MKVEISKELFDKVFDIAPIVSTIQTETYEEVMHHNESLGSVGSRVWNYASSKDWQYYIYDINI